MTAPSLARAKGVDAPVATLRDALGKLEREEQLLDGLHFDRRLVRKRKRALSDLATFAHNRCVEAAQMQRLSQLESARAKRAEEALRELQDAADRLSFEVQYFDEHPPELCAMKRAALHVDGMLKAAGREIYREGAAQVGKEPA